MPSMVVFLQTLLLRPQESLERPHDLHLSSQKYPLDVDLYLYRSRKGLTVSPAYFSQKVLHHGQYFARALPFHRFPL